ATTARKAHPDRDRANDAATGNFQDIQEAYETLRDPSRKTRYDKAIVEWSRREDLRKLDEARRREESLNRATRSRRRAAPASASSGHSGQDKYFGYDARAPKPAATAKPPPGASTAWEEMKYVPRGQPCREAS
ncbi:MAG: DnaJ domain-containing protein, partial [Acidobacteria bacterium]|nr:DnaJ domain-containing protein [Acidobacteriota bacterium]